MKQDRSYLATTSLLRKRIGLHMRLSNRRKHQARKSHNPHAASKLWCEGYDHEMIAQDLANNLKYWRGVID